MRIDLFPGCNQGSWGPGKFRATPPKPRAVFELRDSPDRVLAATAGHWVLKKRQISAWSLISMPKQVVC